MKKTAKINDLTWIFVGLLIAVVAIALLFIKSTKPTPRPKPVPSHNKPQFEFYTLLPRNQIDVPDPVLEAKEAKQAPLPPQSVYTLQIAALPSYARADQLKAELILQGYKANIESANGIYRVIIGPFETKSQAEKIRENLRLAHIDSLLRKTST